MSIPAHILAQIPHLAAEGNSPDQIADLLRIRKEDVEAELDRVNTTSSPKPDPTSDEPGKVR